MSKPESLQMGPLGWLIVIFFVGIVVGQAGWKGVGILLLGAGLLALLMWFKASGRKESATSEKVVECTRCNDKGWYFLVTKPADAPGEAGEIMVKRTCSDCSRGQSLAADWRHQGDDIT